MFRDEAERLRARDKRGRLLPIPLEQRFAENVQQVGDCLEWTGGTYPDGYGRFYVRGRKVAAHRYAYGRTFGPVPAGRCVCHHCDNRNCVRVSHLFLGTFQDNMDDMNAKGRNNGGGPLGEANGFSRLTAAQIPEIRRRYAAGESGPDLAREFGVSQGTVSLIALRKRWKHIPEEAT